jgi:hypothetical protein
MERLLNEQGKKHIQQHEQNQIEGNSTSDYLERAKRPLEVGVKIDAEGKIEIEIHETK